MLSEKEVNTNIMVVAVVGVGGIGKTTLAQKVFNDEALNAEFEKSIWLSINKDFDKVDLLRTIITQAGGQHGREKALAVLQPILATSLKGKKLFLVLDDVWDHEAWDDVLKTSLSNVVAQGSRVLVTTRDERVARRMKAVLPYHHVDKLEEEDAWSLLKKQARQVPQRRQRLQVAQPVDGAADDQGVGVVERPGLAAGERGADGAPTALPGGVNLDAEALVGDKELKAVVFDGEERVLAVVADGHRWEDGDGAGEGVADAEDAVGGPSSMDWPKRGRERRRRSMTRPLREATGSKSRVSLKQRSTEGSSALNDADGVVGVAVLHLVGDGS
ncbi:hypothetical protein ZWY2020_015791 [Hordeum vulgare]|nr:hypothetical protein ZWY2020_015791 [Hordeum vulgare]